MPLNLVLACVAIACSGITDEITNVEANSLIIFFESGDDHKPQHQIERYLNKLSGDNSSTEQASGVK